VNEAGRHDHRGTIFVEQGEILAHEAHPGDQYVLRVHAPRAARTARAGSFAHVRCAASLPMRRPLSLMRADAEAGWLEILYKAVGEGTRLLAERRVGETLDLMAPIGRASTRSHSSAPRCRSRSRRGRRPSCFPSCLTG
jgi:dihydroorotate dehydrogenase electron transfer subunit